MTARHACSFAGQCETDPQGDYASERICRRLCSPREKVELQYEIYQYALEEALELAPSDQVAVVKRLTGARISRTSVREAVQALLQFHARNPSMTGVVEFPELYPYVKQVATALASETVAELVDDLLRNNSGSVVIDFLLYLEVDLLAGEYQSNDPRHNYYDDGYEPPYYRRILDSALEEEEVEVIQRLLTLFPAETTQWLRQHLHLHTSFPSIRELAVDAVLAGRYDDPELLVDLLPTHPELWGRVWVMDEEPGLELIESVFDRYGLLPSYTELARNSPLWLSFALDVGEPPRAELEATLATLEGEFGVPLESIQMLETFLE
jgi:hypothetical protein